MQFFRISRSYKEGFLYSASVFAFIETFLGITGISLKDIFEKITNIGNNLYLLALITISLYLLLTFIIRCFITKKRNVSFKIRNINFNVKIGDIFKEKGLKVIPFNEHFDTNVDDKIISKNTLHGSFILNYIQNPEDLKSAIDNCEDVQNLNWELINNKKTFPLCRIIKYKDYLLLSFTHFDNNNTGHIAKIEYEKCLTTMWKEIRRLYSGETVILPLLGSGITKFDDINEKCNFDFLKCIICTFKASDETFIKPINIVVTEEVWNDLRLYDRLDALVI